MSIADFCLVFEPALVKRQLSTEKKTKKVSLQSLYMKTCRLGQCTVENYSWHDIIGEGTIADAILDRIVNSSHRINLEGESLRTRILN